MATMGGIRYGRWDEERDKIVYEQKGWKNQHGSGGGGRGGGGGGGGAHDDGWVFDGRRWIRYYKGWCRVPAGDRSCVAENDKKRNDIGHEYYHHQALKKGASNYTVLQPVPRTVQCKQYYDDHQEYENVDSKALKKGTSNYTVLQPPSRTVQWNQYYDDHQEYEDVDSKAAEYIRRNHEKFFQAAQMESYGYC